MVLSSSLLQLARRKNDLRDVHFALIFKRIFGGPFSKWPCKIRVTFKAINKTLKVSGDTNNFVSGSIGGWKRIFSAYVSSAKLSKGSFETYWGSFLECALHLHVSPFLWERGSAESQERKRIGQVSATSGVDNSTQKSKGKCLKQAIINCHPTRSSYTLTSLIPPIFTDKSFWISKYLNQVLLRV